MAITSQTTALIAMLFSSTISNQLVHGFASQQPITGTLCAELGWTCGTLACKSITFLQITLTTQILIQCTLIVTLLYKLPCFLPKELLNHLADQHSYQFSFFSFYICISYIWVPFSPFVSRGSREVTPSQYLKIATLHCLPESLEIHS